MEFFRKFGKVFDSTPMSREEIARRYPMTSEQKQKLKEKDPFLELWPAFGISTGGWTVNEQFRHFEGPKLKSRFFFDESHMSYIANSKFATKIGLNAEQKIPHKFIGFSYTSKERRAELEKWLGAFPWAQLITDVNDDGLTNENSKKIQLKGTAID